MDVGDVDEDKMREKVKSEKMDIPVPKTIPNITDNTTNQQCQERKVRVCRGEHVPLQIDDRERFEVRVENSVDETNV